MSDILSPAPKDYVWPRCPEADRYIEDIIHQFLDHHTFAHTLSERMHIDTSTHFSAWVDHVIIPSKMLDRDLLKTLGFWEEKKVKRPVGGKVYFHPYADLPRILVSSKAKDVGCAIMVEDIWRFQLMNKLSLPIEGAPYSPYRLMRMMQGASEFLVVERRGSQDLVVDTREQASVYLKMFERWNIRKREFDSETKGMKETLSLAKQLAAAIGTGRAAHIFLKAERIYWEARNHAGRMQKARQDQLGLGWGNHDHHTFRSSRAQFPTLIQILLTLGFKKRERYYAGSDAGWGAQVMEQPEDGTIIFADVDLAPEDISVDFSKKALPDLKRPGTIGLWCGLHGESILQAGMHHLEAKFDYEQLKTDLKERAVEVMPPFSDFPHLRQAFTKGEMWRVDPVRLEALRSLGRISDEAYQQIKEKGAVGSHLENLQRKDGFKGFNQRGVSHIIAAVNPEKMALDKSSGKGAA